MISGYIGAIAKEALPVLEGALAPMYLGPASWTLAVSPFLAPTGKIVIGFSSNVVESIKGIFKKAVQGEENEEIDNNALGEASFGDRLIREGLGDILDNIKAKAIRTVVFSTIGMGFNAIAEEQLAEKIKIIVARSTAGYPICNSIDQIIFRGQYVERAIELAELIPGYVGICRGNR